MELDDRKMKILDAIILTYLETGEPVGSRTISKYTDLNLSSATIRNEMADLEEMGYIVQPYTSAGRIPSDKGYRTYVDYMLLDKRNQLEKREQEVNELENLLHEKVDKVEELLQNIAKSLANNTNYASLITSPHHKKCRLKFIQLSMLEPGKLLCIIVLDGNIVKNRFFGIEKDLSKEELLKFNILLNTSLTGLCIEEINLGIFSKLNAQAGEHGELIRDIMTAISDAITSSEDLEVYTSGATNIFKYPELSDREKASELIYTLEEKKMLTNLIAEQLNPERNTGIQIYIGQELTVKNMQDCSVVTATYEIEEGVQGTIGIIGPKRMDYEKVVEALNKVKTQLDNAFRKN
ncbi:heat-inducible transcriptional repressor HrcA [Parasporobacterium paucivorans]|uniref:Heat-inducible transcription repressor HrcA n=1 Tax=Parasporobacterium paucivorans DSM 15970 TaxID=1122934 RepID=A0A1M6C1H8_9FIRM|nr:heat-inducible transcriptional repressor HrcA [Parasporobacterium paucivorans]SHI54895.1 heat-inducible transcription repressor HrcA [Parasporobacterium paucivorans DSM 15970]